MDLRNITRCEGERCCGWMVRIYQGKKALIHRYFGDSKYGGKRKALKMATLFRDSVRPLFPTKPHPGVNPPGPGRIFRTSIFRRAAYHEVWQAEIQTAPNQGHVATSRSIAYWGVKKAKALCEEWLKRKQAEQKKNYAPILKKTRQITRQRRIRGHHV